MKTTLNLNAELLAALRRISAERGETMSGVVEDALRGYFQRSGAPEQALRPLPTFRGGARVDVADRDALERAMEE